MAGNVNTDESSSTSEPSESAGTRGIHPSPVEDAEARKKRIKAIQEQITAGVYDNEEQMEKALEALLKEMSGRS